MCNIIFDVASNSTTTFVLSGCNELQQYNFSYLLLTLLSKFVSVIPRTEVFVLNASALNSSTLENKLFTYKCPKCMALSLNRVPANPKNKIP